MTDSDVRQCRIIGCIVSLISGVVIPAFLISPYSLNSSLFYLMPTGVKVFLISCLLFGIWLFLISVFADKKTIYSVMQVFSAPLTAEAFLLLLPLILIVGSVGLWRTIIKGSGR